MGEPVKPSATSETPLAPHGIDAVARMVGYREAAEAVIGGTESAGERKVWLWKNFVDGRPEYWAFDNPYPCHENGDPITLGEPCGYAIVKPSTQGRHDVSEAQVIEAIKRASASSSAVSSADDIIERCAQIVEMQGRKSPRIDGNSFYIATGQAAAAIRALKAITAMNQSSAAPAAGVAYQERVPRQP